MLLPDIERKMYRIICNYIAVKQRTPTIDELTVKTGRSVNGVYVVLHSLNNRQLIVWDRSQPESIRIVAEKRAPESNRWYKY